MSRLAYILIIALIPIISVAQQEARKPFRVDGRITDAQLMPVSYAHILILSRSTGCISDYYGKFNIGAYPGDTLTISAVSFHKAIFVLPDTIPGSLFTFNFILQPDTILLQEQVIYPWPETFAELRKEIIQMRTEEPEPKLLLSMISPKDLKNSAYPEGGIRMQGPLSLLYNRFSKEARTRKAMEKIRLGEKVQDRYNPYIVSRITGLTDMVQVNKLIDYCALEPNFILDSTDYELYVAILGCYNEYFHQVED